MSKLDLDKYNDIIEHFNSESQDSSTSILNSDSQDSSTSVLNSELSDTDNNTTDNNTTDDIIPDSAEHFTVSNKKSKDTIIDISSRLVNNISVIKEHFKQTKIKPIAEPIAEHFAPKDPFKKLEDFFKDIGKFFKKVKEAFTFDQKKAISILATIIVPFVGQLFGRIYWLNGSLDQPWLFFFAIPPLTLLPALLMMFGVVKKGKGGEPWDYYILLPIIVNIASTLILPRYFDSKKAFIVKYILMAISFIIVYWIRSRKICKTSAKISKILSDSLLTYISV